MVSGCLPSVGHLFVDVGKFIFLSINLNQLTPLSEDMKLGKWKPL